MKEDKIAEFETSKEAKAFAEAHNIIAFPHPNEPRGFILVSLVPHGVCAVHENGRTGEILTDW